ncbi:MAG: response regulator [Hyphomicrobium sp.]|jgi:DNA-binding NarL/FixJ family response regulator|nr:response regulator [Hyphomicrobium sp.]
MKRVMICEDDLLLAMDLAHEVEEAGSQVVGTFYSSFDAWDAAAILRPDIAIVDLQLADGDSGLSLATHLAALGCKVIVVSGSTLIHPELGRIPHSFVSKPVPAGIIAELTGTR